MVKDVKNDLNAQDYEELAVEDVAYGTQHALNVLLDILIEKGIVNEQEFKDKLDAMILQSEDVDDVDVSDQVSVDLPDEQKD
ncbi:hypothetical protein K9L97_00545 [Candidatus Woesearchaeota archaeon]|nr:hypothetical protein [Candidatus Woesearchaeota archaeon]